VKTTQRVLNASSAPLVTSSQECVVTSPVCTGRSSRCVRLTDAGHTGRVLTSKLR